MDASSGLFLAQYQSIAARLKKWVPEDVTSRACSLAQIVCLLSVQMSVMEICVSLIR